VKLAIKQLEIFCITELKKPPCLLVGMEAFQRW